MSLLSLPREIIVLIASFLKAKYHKRTCNYYPEISVLFLVSKRFHWLNDYRVAHVRGNEYFMWCEYLNMQGKIDGPNYIFNSYDRSFDGYFFQRNEKKIGDYVFERVGSNWAKIIYDGQAFYHTDDKRFPLHDIGRYRGCRCSYCTSMIKLYHDLQKIDPITFNWINSITSPSYKPSANYYPMRHIRELDGLLSKITVNIKTKHLKFDYKTDPNDAW